MLPRHRASIAALRLPSSAEGPIGSRGVPAGGPATPRPDGRLPGRRGSLLRGTSYQPGRRTTPTFQEIYALHAESYDALVGHEDYEGHLLPALAGIAPLEGAEVIEFGAGTGRLTRLLAPLVKRIRGYDASSQMLTIAERYLSQMHLGNWELGVADNKRLPVEDAAADIAVAGWSFGHAVDWFPDAWRHEIGAAVDEMARVLRPGGTAIILETMTTGSETPAPPSDGLAAYYRWLEAERGFTSTSIRTDYRFASLDEADRLVRFFFGDELADRVRRERWVILPENTGIWWRQYA